MKLRTRIVAAMLTVFLVLPLLTSIVTAAQTEEINELSSQAETSEMENAESTEEASVTEAHMQSAGEPEVNDQAQQIEASDVTENTELPVGASAAEMLLEDKDNQEIIEEEITEIVETADSEQQITEPENEKKEETPDDVATDISETIEQSKNNISTVDPETDKDSGTTTEKQDQEEEQEALVAEQETETVSVPRMYSMRPIPEIKAYLNLAGYDNLDLTKVPAYMAVGMLQDKDGNPLIVEVTEDGNLDEVKFQDFLENHVVVWSYYKDKEGKRIQDEQHVVQWDDELDLSPMIDEAKLYSIEMIIGSGKQLDASAKRYIVTVYVTQEQVDVLTFEFYSQDEDGTRHKVIPATETSTTTSVYEEYSEQLISQYKALYGDELPESAKKQLNNQLKRLPKEAVIHQYKVLGHIDGSQYFFGINSQLDKHPNVEVSVYPYLQYNMMFIPFGRGETITDQVLNRDMELKDEGYKTTFNTPQNSGNGSIDSDTFLNTYAIVYSSGGEVQSVRMETFMFSDDYAKFDIEAYTLENEEKTDIKYDESRKSVIFDVDTDDPFRIKESNIKYATIIDVVLKDGYPADEDYYFSLDAHSPIWENANSHVIKAVEGLYMDISDASNLPDIKEQLIPSDRTGNYGYKANYYINHNGDTAHCVFFTVFFDDNSHFCFAVTFHNYSEMLNPETYLDYDAAPVVGSVDPWFRVTGVKQGERVLDTYVVENGKATNMDTRYGYGYQTIFVNDKDADLTKLKPIFWPDGKNDKYKIVTTGDKEEVSGETEHDFTNPVWYHAIFNDEQKHTKNYSVEIIKKASGPKLYVFGSEDTKGERNREVFLDEYFEFKHDILIANIGDQPLTGLKVKLDAQNVKLDDYWTVGGNGNDTLDPFDSTKINTQYGELNNLAKIRLLPDGKGEITGTLTISAKDQEDVVIHLTGRALQPEIITDKLGDAVKYVPYSYLIATNNMHDWNTVTFSVAGDLPTGMEFTPETGEIYGAPTEVGSFTFTVTANYGVDYFEPSSKTFTINVLENEDERVFKTSDISAEEDYSIIPNENGDNGYLGEQVSDYRFELKDLEQDDIYISNGNFGQFKKLWINGIELEENVHYTTDEGSTRITVKSQTLKNRDIVKEGRNTISAEFNINGERGEHLKRTSQNFYLVAMEPSNPDKPTDTPTTPDKPTETPTNPDKPADTPTTPDKPTETPTNPDKPTDTPEDRPTNPQIPADTQEEPDNSQDTNNDSNTPNRRTPANQNRADVEETVGITFNIIDGNGNPMADKTLELHSKVQTNVTGSDGHARFASVELGNHTLYVKEQDGTTIAKAQFTLLSGDQVSCNGSNVTVKPGGAISITIQVNGSNATITEVKDDGKNGGKVTTGDNSNLTMWFVVFVVDLVGLAVLIAAKMKKQ